MSMCLSRFHIVSKPLMCATIWIKHLGLQMLQVLGSIYRQQFWIKHAHCACLPLNNLHPKAHGTQPCFNARMYNVKKSILME